MEELPWITNVFGKEGAGMTPRHKRIIKAAILLFDENGYAATSTREIAKKASVAEGTIFKYYSSKKQLMLNISEMVIQNILLPIVSRNLAEILIKPYQSLEDFIQNIMENRLEISKEAIPVFRFLMQEMPFQPAIRELLMGAISKIPFDQCVEKLKREGLIRDLPISSVRMIFITCISGFFLSRYVILPELFPDDPAQDLNNLIGFMARGFGA